MGEETRLKEQKSKSCKSQKDPVAAEIRVVLLHESEGLVFRRLHREHEPPCWGRRHMGRY